MRRIKEESQDYSKYDADYMGSILTDYKKLMSNNPDIDPMMIVAKIAKSEGITVKEVLEVLDFLGEKVTKKSYKESIGEDDEYLTLPELIKFYDTGYFDYPVKERMFEAGWYDWFCKDELLPKKLKKLMPIVKKLANSSVLLLEAGGTQENVRVIFKNLGTPGPGITKDHIIFFNIKEDETMFIIQQRIITKRPMVSRGASETRYFVYEIKDGSIAKTPVDAGSLNEVYDFFKV